MLDVIIPHKASPTPASDGLTVRAEVDITNLTWESIVLCKRQGINDMRYELRKTIDVLELVIEELDTTSDETHQIHRYSSALSLARDKLEEVADAVETW